MPRPSSALPSPPAGDGGFVLLEILIALVIFTTLVLAWARATDDALLAAADANAQRTLRMLTVRKLAEIRAKPADYRESVDGGFEEEVGTDGENPYLDYRWEVEAQEVVAAGHSEDDELEHVFERDEEAESDPVTPSSGTPGGAPGETASKPVLLLRLTLRVSWNPPNAETVDEMRVVTYVPLSEEEQDEIEGGG